MQYKTVYAHSSQAITDFDAANRPIKQVSPSGMVNLAAYNSDSEVSASTGSFVTVSFDFHSVSSGHCPAMMEL
ncbi:MAG: hypothetical protein WC071_08710 [Victivallaceae bacterium]